MAIKSNLKQMLAFVIISAFAITAFTVSHAGTAYAAVACTTNYTVATPLVVGTPGYITFTFTNSGTDVIDQVWFQSTLYLNIYGVLNGDGSTASDVTTSGSANMATNTDVAVGATRSFRILMSPTSAGDYAYQSYANIDTTTDRCSDSTTPIHVYETAPATVPSAPTITGTAGVSENNITWSSVSGADSYDIFENSIFLANTTDTSYTHTGLDNGHHYVYFVKAKNSAGSSGSSNYLTLTPASIPLTTSPDPDITDRDIKLISFGICLIIIYFIVRSFRWRFHV